jgi:putative cell wall-binding protein
MPEEMSDLLKTLNNKNVILVGGAKGECLYDVEIAMKSFGINPIYNNRYVYSAKTNNSQLI